MKELNGNDVQDVVGGFVQVAAALVVADFMVGVYQGFME